MTDTASTLDIPGYKTGTWVLDPAHSEVTFSVRHMMISKVRGTFGMKSATLVAPENPLDAKVEASVDVSSVDTKDEGRDNHLRSADFFDVENHPTMEFRSTGARVENGDFLVDGDLTIRGITKPVVLDATLNKAAEHPLGKRAAIGFNATTTVKRSDFGLAKYVPNVSDEVQIRITTEAMVPKPAQ